MAEYIDKVAATTIPTPPKENRVYQTYNLDDVFDAGWHEAQRCISNLPAADVRERVPVENVMEYRHVKYDPDEFFSAERYPLPMKCSECGKTMRPVHKHCTPDMPRTYFCTFCGVWIYEDNPGIRFNKPKTNADRIRAMSDIQLAKWVSLVHGTCIGFCPMHYDCDGTDCDGQWLDWLQQEATT